uniref:Uncharacterized protein n=1 Tax=Rhizophora mucronata TaxID=61149 RepID=A0A2P2MXR3_RHIMU
MLTASLTGKFRCRGYRAGAVTREACSLRRTGTFRRIRRPRSCWRRRRQWQGRRKWHRWRRKRRITWRRGQKRVTHCSSVWLGGLFPKLLSTASLCFYRRVTGLRPPMQKLFLIVSGLADLCHTMTKYQMDSIIYWE